MIRNRHDRPGGRHLFVDLRWHGGERRRPAKRHESDIRRCENFRITLDGLKWKKADVRELVRLHFATEGLFVYTFAGDHEQKPLAGQPFRGLKHWLQIGVMRNSARVKHDELIFNSMLLAEAVVTRSGYDGIRVGPVGHNRNLVLRNALGEEVSLETRRDDDETLGVPVDPLLHPSEKPDRVTVLEKSRSHGNVGINILKIHDQTRP